MAQRIDPEDIVQSVFRTFFRRAAEGSYQVPDGDTLWKLLLVIALNKIRSLSDFHRAEKRDVRRTKSINSMENVSGEQASADVLRLTIDDLTEELPEAHKHMIRLRIDGFSVDEISRKVERSKRSTERVLQSFRAQLLAELRSTGVQGAVADVASADEPPEMDGPDK